MSYALGHWKAALKTDMGYLASTAIHWSDIVCYSNELSLKCQAFTPIAAF